MAVKDLALLTPELTLLIVAILVILLDLGIKQKKVLVGVSLAGVVVALVFSATLWGQSPRDIFDSMFTLDQFAVFFKFVLLIAVGLVILASQDYVDRFPRFQGEYYALLLISAMAMMLLTSAMDTVSIFISLELSGISLYVLTAFMKDSKSSEAGLKYLMLGAVASAFLLYGMALLFGLTGYTCVPCIGEALNALPMRGILDSPGLLIALVLIIGGFGFKIASFPFQMWVPDVYEGAPTPVTAYLSVASKAAGFAVITRFLLSAFAAPDWLNQHWVWIIAILAAITMTAGNIVALLQSNIKRMFGYSSIAQAGYLMVGLAAIGAALSTEEVRAGLLFFIISYAFTNLGAFIAIIAITNKVDSDEIDSFSGMIKRAPVITVALSLCLISLIGLPPTSGLIAKVLIFSQAVKTGLLWLVIIAVINSVISAFYYLRVVKVMWTGAPAADDKVGSTWALRIALAVCCLFVLLLGIIPGGFVSIAEAAGKIFGL